MECSDFVLTDMSKVFSQNDHNGQLIMDFKSWFLNGATKIYKGYFHFNKQTYIQLLIICFVYETLMIDTYTTFLT